MNNEQFRRLLFDNSQPSAKPNNGANPTGQQSSPNSRSHTSPTGGPGGHALGSRMRSSIPMTPRTLTKPDFARQLAEYRRDDQNPHPSKKFKSSAAPKGTKLPAGYQDRAARLRELEGGNDEDKDKAKGGTGSGIGLSVDGEQKLKILETRFKKGVIDEATFLQRRRELGVGGDLGSTHMIKGLDWDLLRKVKAGEDIQRKEKTEEDEEGFAEERGEGEAEGQGEEKEVDVDEEFDKVLDGNEDAALPSAPKDREKKKGSMAPPPAPASGRKTRDEILKELKASRAAAAAAEAAAAAQENALGARFKRIGDSKVEKKRFIEQDENGRRREVLLITDADGKTKRKARWLDKPGQIAPDAAPAAAVNEAKPLGMEVPAEIAAKAAQAKAAQEADDEDDDIFTGVGADYDPLGDAGSDGDSSDSEEEEEEGEVATKASAAHKAPTAEPAGEPTKSRNYFATTTTQDEKEMESGRANPLTKDPVLLAALKRAASLRQASGEDAGKGEDDGVDKDMLLRRKKFLEEARRREELDAMDMDYGFGGSRGADDEDDEEVILQDTRGGTKRKRGPKKKKGDKDSAADVLSVLEGRKKT